MGIRELELADLPQTSDPPIGPLAAIVNRLTWPFRYGHVEPQPSTGFYTDTTVCIGCKSCEVACKQWNQLAADGLEWTGNSYDNTAELSGYVLAACEVHRAVRRDWTAHGPRRGRPGGDEPRADPRPVAERGGAGRCAADSAATATS